MRVKANFTVFPRKMATGKVIYYYQAYDEDGFRINPHSTGESLKTLAVKKCQQLMKDGLLLPAERKKIKTFAEFAEGWWEWDTCQYLKAKKYRKGLTQAYVDTCKRHTKNWILPYFGKMRLDRITREDCDRFLTNLPEQEKKGQKPKDAGVLTPGTVKKLKTSSANVIYGILRLMLKQAVAEKLILFNPAETVEELTAEGKVVEILTPTEARDMFTPKMKSAVPLLEGPDQAGKEKKDLRKFAFAHELAQVANMTAAVTGMRIGEVLGLKGSCIFENYIRVAGQYDTKHNYRQTKTKKVRQIPTSRTVLDPLDKLKALNGDGFLFSDDGGASPISRYMFNKALAAGLSKIGIDEDEKKQRNLTPHAWRHFFNTTLRVNNVADAKTRAVIGHVTEQMTEHYTDFDTTTFTEIADVQDHILLSETPTAGGTGEPARQPGRVRRYTTGRHEARRALVTVHRKKHRHG